MIALSHVEAVHRIMQGREYERRPLPRPEPIKLAERDTIMLAVAKIRTLRGSPVCRWPEDLGCETQLYLALACQAAWPRLTNVQLAEKCRVPVIEAHFFAELVELARKAEWVAPGIVAAAASILRRQA